MATDQGPVVSSAILRDALVHLRSGKQLTQQEVARKLAWSSSKLIRIENGHSNVTQVDLDALLREYDATAENERLQELNRSARAGGWWAEYKGDFDSKYLDFIGYEAGASFIRQTALVIPGLLQTREYAEVLSKGRTVELRLQRQRELAQRTNPPPPHQFYLLDEAVIRRHIGIETDPAIMPAQLRSIADRVEHDPRVTVRIIPFSRGDHAGLRGVFTLLEFAEVLLDLLYLDSGRGEIVIDQDAQTVKPYRDDFESMIAPALSEEASIEFIRTAAKEMSR
jgi:transcriptional regulator with XRE-family HTH domain